MIPEKVIKIVEKTFLKEKEETLNVLATYTNGDILDIYFDFNKVWELVFFGAGNVI